MDLRLELIVGRNNPSGETSCAVQPTVSCMACPATGAVIRGGMPGFAGDFPNTAFA